MNNGQSNGVKFDVNGEDKRKIGRNMIQEGHAANGIQPAQLIAALTLRVSAHSMLKRLKPPPKSMLCTVGKPRDGKVHWRMPELPEFVHPKLSAVIGGSVCYFLPDIWKLGQSECKFAQRYV